MNLAKITKSPWRQRKLASQKKEYLINALATVIVGAIIVTVGLITA